MNSAVDTKPAYAAMDAGHAKPGLRGIHHLAIVTEDMRGTLDFYVRVLRMPLVHALTTANTATHGKGAPPFRAIPPLFPHPRGRPPTPPAPAPRGRGPPPFRAIPHLFLDRGGDSLLAFFEDPKGAVGAS